MIFDHLENAKRYYALHPTFEAAFEFLRRKDLASLPAGRNEVDGDRLYAVVVRRQGKGKDAAQLEMHKQYIDIQFTVSGTDVIGWKTTSSCAKTGLGIDKVKDLEFFTARPDTWITTPPTTFAIFYPEDAHAPLGGEGELQKVVMKVLLR